LGIVYVESGCSASEIGFVYKVYCNETVVVTRVSGAATITIPYLGINHPIWLLLLNHFPKLRLSC